MEGTKVGVITPLQAITCVRKDKNQAISEYCIDGVKWVSKVECLELAAQGKLDVAVCSSRLGNRYVRARVNSPIQRDLAKIVEK